MSLSCGHFDSDIGYDDVINTFDEKLLGFPVTCPSPRCTVLFYARHSPVNDHFFPSVCMPYDAHLVQSCVDMLSGINFLMLLLVIQIYFFLVHCFCASSCSLTMIVDKLWHLPKLKEFLSHFNVWSTVFMVFLIMSWSTSIM